MTDLERLLALEDIRMLRARYSRLLDAKRWDELVDVLSPDCVLDTTQAGKLLRGAQGKYVEPVHGRDAIIAWMEARYRHRAYILHIPTIPEIYFDDDHHAHGVWRLETYIKESRPDHPGTGISFGTAYDTYEKTGGRWWMTSNRVTLEMLM